jgi:hypothetical protein
MATKPAFLELLTQQVAAFGHRLVFSNSGGNDSGEVYLLYVLNPRTEEIVFVADGESTESNSLEIERWCAMAGRPLPLDLEPTKALYVRLMEEARAAPTESVERYLKRAGIAVGRDNENHFVLTRANACGLSDTYAMERLEAILTGCESATGSLTSDGTIPD